MDDLDSLRESVSRNSRWVRIGAMAVVGGLVAEVLILLWFTTVKSWVENGLLIAATLIIAAGVWAEDHFSHRAGAAAERLQQISDEKIAEANARAAEANQKAQEASLELARLKAPRVLTAEQRGRIVNKLKKFSGTEYDITISDGDPEILDFVFLVEVVLSTAEWTEHDWQGIGEGFIREGMPIIRLGASVANVMIGVHVNQPPKLWECALALSDALVTEGVDAMTARLTPHRMSSTNANAIHILIGRKL